MVQMTSLAGVGLLTVLDVLSLCSMLLFLIIIGLNTSCSGLCLFVSDYFLTCRVLSGLLDVIRLLVALMWWKFIFSLSI